MARVLFVCYGNICRSPMAEFVMKELVRKAGCEKEFQIASAATSCEEIGNDVYPPAKRKLKEKGIPFSHRAARRLTRADYEEYDLLIGMDETNRRDMKRICGGDDENKIRLLLDTAEHPREVADPWYTDDFEATWKDVLEGCTNLLEELR